MSATILWMGPVSAANLEGALPAGWTLRVYNRGENGGLGSDAFKNWALTLGEDPLSVLAPGASRVIIAGFSAAHGATEILLQKVVARGDTRLEGLLSCDSYYVSTEQSPVKAGHLAWLRWIIDSPGGRKAWFTSSTNGGPGYLSASASLKKLAYTLQMQWSEAALRSVAGMPVGAVLTAREPVVWLDYGQTYKHVQHATKLAPAAFRAGFAGGNAETSTSASTGGFGFFALGLLLAALKFGAKR